MQIYNCSLVNIALTNLIFTKALFDVKCNKNSNIALLLHIVKNIMHYCDGNAEYCPQTFDQYYIYLIIISIIIHKIKRKCTTFYIFPNTFIIILCLLMAL